MSKERTSPSKRPRKNPGPQLARKKPKETYGHKYIHVTTRHEGNGIFTIWEGDTEVTGALLAEKNACETLLDLRLHEDIITELMSRFRGRRMITALARKENGRTVTNLEALRELKAPSGEPLFQDENILKVFAYHKLYVPRINSMINHGKMLSDSGIETPMILKMHVNGYFNAITKRASEENRPVEHVMLDWAKKAALTKKISPKAIRTQIAANSEENTGSNFSAPALLDEIEIYHTNSHYAAYCTALEAIYAAGMTVPVIRTILSKTMWHNKICFLAAPAEGHNASNIQALFALRDASSEPFVTNDNIGTIMTTHYFKMRIKSLIRNAELLSQEGITTPVILTVHQSVPFSDVMGTVNQALNANPYEKEKEDAAILQALYKKIDTIAPGMRIEPVLPEMNVVEPSSPVPAIPNSHDHMTDFLTAPHLPSPNNQLNHLLDNQLPTLSEAFYWSGRISPQSTRDLLSAALSRAPSPGPSMNFSSAVSRSPSPSSRGGYGRSVT